MMKNKKLVIAFILIIAFLLLMATTAKASDVEQIPVIVTNNEATEQPANNEPTNNEPVANNQQATTNNTTNNIINPTNNTSGTSNSNTLPQTGVQEDTTLFVFIAICIASAIYAYIKIRKYNNVH